VTAADYADFGAPQANANTIASTGVPLLTLPNLIINYTGAINAGASSVSPTFPMTQPGYEVYVNMWETGSGSAAAVQMQMQWWDATVTNMLAEETYYIWPGTASGGNVIIGHGPVKAENLIVVCKNLSSAMQYTENFIIYQRSHIYTRDDWRTLTYANSASGLAIATNEMPAGLIGYGSAAQLTTAVASYELPLYTGPCFLWAQSSSNTSDLTITIQNSTDPNVIGVGSKYLQFISGANGIFSGQIILPRYQSRLQLTNGNAATKTCDFSLHIFEQAC
jgi:hypothetical protein